MNRYFYVLYRSIIPNRRITLPILHKSYNIGKDVEDYILTGASAKLCIQKILNFLFVCLDNEKDYMKFCLVINSISVMTNLPHRMIYGNLIANVSLMMYLIFESYSVYKIAFFNPS